MHPKKLMVLAGALAACLTLPTAHAQETLSHGRFTDVTLYRPHGAVSSFVLFLSGDGGWNQGVVGMAEALADEGALVAGISVPQLVANLEQDGASCVMPDGDLENLSHYVQSYAKLPTYYTPLLVGYSSGASLAYAMLAQAPTNTFSGAISLGFCPELSIRKSLCRGEGLGSTPRQDGGVTLLPAKALGNPWVALQGEQDAVCSAAVTRQFVVDTGNATLVSLPNVGHGYSVTRNWLPQFLSTFHQLQAGQPAMTPPAGLADLPLVEVPAAGGSDLFAVLLSGDGGWAGLDKAVGSALAARGVSVVGVDSLRYFWTPRTPEGLATDLDRVLRFYAAHWGKSRAVVIGYSQGADVLPFALNRLPSTSRNLVARSVLIAPGEQASFEFHLANWVLDDAGDRATLPEAMRLDAARTLCLYGRDEDDSLCEKVPAGHVTAEALPGGHHFDGAYETLANRVLTGLEIPTARLADGRGR
jgi:type IV secretory pathway VirJ component